MGERPDLKAGDSAAFIAYWAQTSGAERANYQLFLEDFCRVLALPLAGGQMGVPSKDNYVFERSVEKTFDDGTKTTKFIDLYKKGCFVLEAKQSSKRRPKPADPDQFDFLGEAGEKTKAGTARRGTAGWDTSMLAALNQAREYAQLLPSDHGWPPFLIIVDVGHVIELWADFSGQGKRYTHFPDRQSYRIELADLADDKVQKRLKAVWTDPQSLDPTKRSAEVTRDIAERLAVIARALEKAGRDPHQVAEFLMRCLFTMFAEDAQLIPKGSFADLLKRKKDDPATFKPALEALWRAMNDGGYAGPIDTFVKKFNGWLFKDPRALDLPAEAIHELAVAAGREWQDVEPAIFGTLLERALDPRERSKLGAHYTPRAYVERLVQPTIIEPLTEDWQAVQAQAKQFADRGELIAARDAVRSFHAKLCHTRVLDPACGTGNFLYVSMELMKKLEGEVLDALTAIAGPQHILTIPGATVHPTQFLGLEINARAVEIAHLVVWLGFLKWQIRTNGLASVTEPILDRTEHIFHRDAVLAYDDREIARDEHGKPQSRWDGITKKKSPVTGEDIPDETARIELTTYTHPHRPDWPEAEFIVGNPPFVAGKDLRAELGDGYAEALWKAHPDMPKSADFVTYWWDNAAGLLTRKGTKLRRFGLITTNSITQTFSRRVIERHLKAKDPIHLVFAIPDHPWLKAADKAAVRIAMTVAAAGSGMGILSTVAHEMGLDTDTPVVELTSLSGHIGPKLAVGADLTLPVSLLANAGICNPGVKLHGAGFIVTPAEAENLGLGTISCLEEYVRPYRNGRDMTQAPRGVLVIDLYPLSINEVRQRFPAVYQWVFNRVKPERDQNNRPTYREAWWTFGEPRKELRDFTAGLAAFISTVETSKHRIFWQFDASILPDNKLVNIGLEDPTPYAVLSSRLHVSWAISAGGWLGVGNDPVYVKSRVFDPFPFPDLSELPPDRVARLRELGERLDAHRKARQAEHPDLSMTGMYNVLERVRALDFGTESEPLTDKERDVYERGLIGILKEIHDDIDRAVFEAYGWSDLGEKLVGRPGATMPIDIKAPGQEEAEEELLTRLVALNRERAEEEKRGIVRWLRPDYQIPRFGKGLAREEQIEADIEAPLAPAALPAWPKDPLDQIRLVRGRLLSDGQAVSAEEIAAGFKGGRNRRAAVERVLETLVAIGQANTDSATGRTFITR
jgi:hypothetical protein